MSSLARLATDQPRFDSSVVAPTAGKLVRANSSGDLAADSGASDDGTLTTLTEGALTAGTIASGATAPDLRGKSLWIYASGSSVTTIQPLDGDNGQVVVILNLSANALTVGRGNAVLNGSAVQVLNQYSALLLIFNMTTGFWHQLAPLSANG